MARRATSKAKGHTTRQKAAPAPVAEELPVEAPRRGRKPKPRDARVAELSLADTFFPGGDEAASQSPSENDEASATSTQPARHREPLSGSEFVDDTSYDGGDAAPEATFAKARRSRRSKVQPASGSEATSDAGTPLLDALTDQMDAAVSSTPSNTAAANDADDAPETSSTKARRGRPRKASPAEQSPALEAEQDMSAVAMGASAADQVGRAPPESSEASAARWDPTTGTATFNWPTIEQVAATDGPNQAMAKLLLAARAEGANSRWPF